MKYLQAIQTISKIGEILSKIIFICCLVGAIGCAVGIVSLPFGDKGLFKIGGVTVYGLIANKSGIEPDSFYPTLAGFLIVCIGQAIPAKFAEKYFVHELAAGTPFTVEGGKELLRLGILTISVPLGSLILAKIVCRLVEKIVGCSEAIELSGTDSVALGIMFIVMSLMCLYGAELLEKQIKE